MRFNLFLIITLLLAINVRGQNIQGHVMTANEAGEMESLPGANIVWLGTTEGTVSDDSGFFTIAKSAVSNFLRVSFSGFIADTIEVGNQTFLHVMLTSLNELNEIQIKGKRQSANANTINAVNTVELNQKELLKAACCNLSESFETSLTVDAEYADAITGARTIKLLGLDGIYSQILTENIQVVRGLSSSYGLTYIPGPWVESIQISKGPGSVVNGYEGISGSINTELKKAYDTEKEKYFINLYGSNSGRLEGNFNIAHRFNPKLSTMLLAHTSIAQTKLDHNDDTFLDMPLSKNYILMNRWNYSSENMHEAQAGIKFIYSDLQGGQTFFDPLKERTTENGYGVGVDTRRIEGYIKNGFVFHRPNTSVGIILNGSIHTQKSYFGLNDYDAEERFVQANVIGQTFVFNTNHTLKGGASVLNNNLDETYQSVNYKRNEVVPGIFAEYNYNVNDKFTILAGYRIDFHNLFGTFNSPRLHLKYTLNPNTTLRASAGKAYRVADVLAENTTMLTSSRQFVLEEDLLPEQAWNYGITFIQSFETNSRRGTFTLDVYRTNFLNQVVIDVDRDAHGIYVSNLNGESFSNVLQTEVNYELFKNFDLRLAYRYTDAKTTFDNNLLEAPLVYKHRGLINFAWLLEESGWVFDATMQFYGPSRLPDLSNNPAAHYSDPYSPAYILLLGQITKKFKSIDLYVGSENITNYTQHNPVIGYEDPFGPDFDASVVYAPVMNRKFYAGLRFTIKENN